MIIWDQNLNYDYVSGYEVIDPSHIFSKDFKSGHMTKHENFSDPYMYIYWNAFAVVLSAKFSLDDEMKNTFRMKHDYYF